MEQSVRWLAILCTCLGFIRKAAGKNALPPPPQLKPKVESPPPPPFNPKAEAVSPFDIKVSWGAPDGYSNMLGYSVKINVYNQPNSFFFQNFGVDDDMTYSKTDLRPGTTYEVTITSKNLRHKTTSVKLLVTTPPSFVPKKPTGFEQGYVSEDWARYRWNYPDVEDEVTGYTMTIRNNVTDDTREVVIPSHRQSYILTQLEPGIVYILTLAAFNVNGTGPARVTYFKTKDYIPPKPSIVFIQPVDSTVVLLKWRPDDKDGKSGLIKGYHVSYQEVGNDEGMYLIDTESADITQILITELEPETQYSVVVAGYTSSCRDIDIDSDPRTVTTLPKDYCKHSLGMESGGILDSAISASSYLSEFDVLGKGRIRKEGGAWCPSQNISQESNEYLEIDFGQYTKLTQVEIQTNPEYENGPEYAQKFRLEYQVTNDGHWRRYKQNKIDELLFGNAISFLTQLIELDPPILCTKIRLIPYSTVPKELCMQVEVYGCILNVELPIQPIDFRASAVSDTEVELSWSPAAENDSIDNFALTVSENGETVVPEIEMASDSSGLPLRYLSPGTTYIFKLVGQNEWGQGEESVVRLKMPDKDEKPLLYFTNIWVIRRLNIETRYEEVVLPTRTPRSQALDVDHDLDLMFYSTMTNEDIYSLNINQKEDDDDGFVKGVNSADKTCNLGFNESSVEPKIVVSVLEGRFGADSLAVDWLYKNIYWTVKGANKISVASYSGKYSKVLIDEGLDKPNAIALDPENGFMYWVEQGKAPKIRRSGMDGFQRETVVRGWDGLGTPNVLTIDFVNKRLYWVDTKFHSISSANMDGSDVRREISSKTQFSFPASIAVLDNSIYYSESTSKSIKYVNLAQKNLTDVSLRRYAVVDMVLYHAKRQSLDFAPEAKKLCRNAQCDHMCLPTARYSENDPQTISCSCSEGYILKDNRFCVEKTESEVL